jgi:hypothetical protein
LGGRRIEWGYGSVKQTLVVLDADFVQAAEDLDETAQLALDDAQALAHFLVVDGGVVEEELYVTQRGRDRIVGIVPDTSNEVDDRLQMVGVHAGSESDALFRKGSIDG